MFLSLSFSPSLYVSSIFFFPFLPAFLLVLSSLLLLPYSSQVYYSTQSEGWILLKRANEILDRVYSIRYLQTSIGFKNLPYSLLFFPSPCNCYLFCRDGEEGRKEWRKTWLSGEIEESHGTQTGNTVVFRWCGGETACSWERKGAV